MNSGANEGCVFCRIVRGELGTEFVAETGNAVAFRDLAPQAPVHVLIVPRRHIAGLRHLEEGDIALGGELLRLAATVARQEGLWAEGYRLVANDGRGAGQTVFHLHFHLLGGRSLTTAFG